jgi:hypothetical protein
MVRLAVALVALLLLPAPALAHRGLPLGSPSLRETRSTDTLAPGVTYTRIVRGTLSPRDGCVPRRPHAVERIPRPVCSLHQFSAKSATSSQPGWPTVKCDRPSNSLKSVCASDLA